MIANLFALLLFLGLFLALIIFAIFYRLNYASIKGKRGEWHIASILSSLPDSYCLLNDFFIQESGFSTQIDHIVISEFGIFVIETKNYSGWIFGTDNAEYWTKNKYGTKYKFYNPIRQNEAHIKALQYILGISPYKFIPIVVFLKGADLKISTQHIVIHPSQLKSVIYSYNTFLLTTAEKEYIFRQLLSINIVDPEIRKTHLRTIENNVYRKNVATQQGKCPRCGGNLVFRNGKYGKFWGCSNYPKCTYTHK